MSPDHNLVLVMGVPGSGKSTLSRCVVERTSWVYLDSDFVIDPFYTDTRESADHQLLRPTFYQVVYNIAEQNLRLGNTVLIDSPLVRPIRDPAWWAGMQQLVSRAGAGLKVVRCFCDEQVLRARIEARGAERDRSKLADWPAFLTDQPIRRPIAVDHIEIDTGMEAKEHAAQRVIGYVLGRRPHPA
jgi:predicted kinase